MLIRQIYMMVTRQSVLEAVILHCAVLCSSPDMASMTAGSAAGISDARLGDVIVQLRSPEIAGC
jgi:hypothetical protein